VGPASVAAEVGLALCGVARPTALLLLGHMRSGSTLLLHLLLTNPQIAACGERNARYDSVADLAHLALTARLTLRWPLRPLRYVADQVNHNGFTPNPALLLSRRVRVLFVLREPRSAIASLLELSRIHYEQAWSAAQAVEYFVTRMEGLADLGGPLRDPKRAALVRYEALISQPQRVLEALRQFLNLPVGFSASYATHDFTGKRGDPGPKISAGRILAPSNAPAVELEAPELARLVAASARCHAALAPLDLCPA
jgi:Sulfotransferase domain